MKVLREFLKKLNRINQLIITYSELGIIVGFKTNPLQSLLVTNKGITLSSFTGDEYNETFFKLNEINKIYGQLK